ncbi:glycine-rich cell wall structural protein [Drosophila ficusphila]|uniref:glycine-rich cell wall structural protein n=1 Tax=Drosophila ficusphila TaxID=30025 RepID=UPI0007E80BC2|nr:glycine-rich cell wall structural protein [Drosophila ficusphila]
MRHLTAFAILAFSALALTEAAVYIGGGCYDCNPPGGQGPGVYTGVNGGGGGRPIGGGGNYYNNAGGGGGGGRRPVYSGNFGPGYSNGGGGGRGGGGYGGGGGYDDGFTQVISG